MTVNKNNTENAHIEEAPQASIVQDPVATPPGAPEQERNLQEDIDRGIKMLGDLYPELLMQARRLAWHDDNYESHHGPARCVQNIVGDACERVLRHPERLARVQSPMGYLMILCSWEALKIARKLYDRSKKITFVEQLECCDDDGIETMSVPITADMTYAAFLNRDFIDGLLQILEGAFVEDTRQPEVLWRWLDGEAVTSIARDFGVTRGTIHVWLKSVQKVIEANWHLAA